MQQKRKKKAKTKKEKVDLTQPKPIAPEGLSDETADIFFELPARQREFVRHYLLHRNASRAMREAGYESKNQNVDSSKLLAKPSIQQIIEENERYLQKKFDITQDAIIQELALLGFARSSDVFEWDDKGEVKLIPQDRMNDRGLAYIDSIKIERGTVTTKNEKTGEEKVETYISDMKITTLGKEKKGALELVGRAIGMWKEGSGAGSGLSKEARRAAIDRIRSHLKRRSGQE